MTRLAHDDEALGSAVNKMLALVGKRPVVSMSTIIELVDRMVESDIKLDVLDYETRANIRARLIEIAGRYELN